MAVGKDLLRAEERGTVFHHALKTGAFGQAGWDVSRGPRRGTEGTAVLDT